MSMWKLHPLRKACGPAGIWQHYHIVSAQPIISSKVWRVNAFVRHFLEVDCSLGNCFIFQPWSDDNWNSSLPFSLQCADSFRHVGIDFWYRHNTSGTWVSKLLQYFICETVMFVSLWYICNFLCMVIIS